MRERPELPRRALLAIEVSCCSYLRLRALLTVQITTYYQLYCFMKACAALPALVVLTWAVACAPETAAAYAAGPLSSHGHAESKISKRLRQPIEAPPAAWHAIPRAASPLPLRCCTRGVDPGGLQGLGTAIAATAARAGGAPAGHRRLPPSQAREVVSTHTSDTLRQELANEAGTLLPHGPLAPCCPTHPALRVSCCMLRRHLQCLVC